MYIAVGVQLSALLLYGTFVLRINNYMIIGIMGG